ncbi:MAG: acyl carrier protein [Lachnospiraceae bacterium]|nr:acyl carrier protein [Lachnospiraceae bacterium]
MFEEIRDIMVEELDLDAEDITMESNFKEDLIIDSLDLFEMVMDVEDKLGIEIPSEDLEKMKTVGDFVKYVEEHKN